MESTHHKETKNHVANPACKEHDVVCAKDSFIICQGIDFPHYLCVPILLFPNMREYRHKHDSISALVVMKTAESAGQ